MQVFRGPSEKARLTIFSAQLPRPEKVAEDKKNAFQVPEKFSRRFVSPEKACREFSFATGNFCSDFFFTATFAVHAVRDNENFSVPVKG